MSVCTRPLQATTPLSSEECRYVTVNGKIRLDQGAALVVRAMFHHIVEEAVVEGSDQVVVVVVQHLLAVAAQDQRGQERQIADVEEFDSPRRLARRSPSGTR